MLVYIVPETNQIVRVSIVTVEDDIAEIKSILNEVINTKGNPTNTRDVQLLSLYELRNYYFNKNT